MAVASELQAAQVLVPAGVALVVVALTHFFTSSRDRENKRREQRISYLVGAFRALCKANNHPHLCEVADEVEQAVADVQLFGTPEQVRLVQQFASDLGKTQYAEMNALLESLRDSLRKEIGASPAKGHVIWLRIGRAEVRESMPDHRVGTHNQSPPIGATARAKRQGSRRTGR